MRAELGGLRFGRLVVSAVVGKNKHGQRIWRCLCDCGNSSDVVNASLRSGNTRSCGCRSGKGNPLGALTHGHARGGKQSPTYKSWTAMRQRCESVNNNRYKYYGAKGVAVCERWWEFVNFLEDMGERPRGMTLDRIDPCGNYEASNCQWATALEQRSNRRDS